MEITKPLCTFFPGNILFLDDENNFLEMLTLNLPANINFTTNTNPEKVVNTILTQDSLLPDLISPIDPLELTEPVETAFFLDLQKIDAIRFNKERFNHNSVLVVDYSMPDMTGIEVCEKLKQSPIKKIMLTGETSNKLAINAFNKGTIDYFISKNDPNLVEHLSAAIHNLQMNYFQQYMTTVLQILKYQHDSLLNHQGFLTAFNTFLSSHNIVEFYLLDSSGSFMGFDIQGNGYCFLVKSNEQLDILADVAENSEMGENIKQAILARKKMPYFFNTNEQNAAVEQWENFSYAITNTVAEFSIAELKLATSNIDCFTYADYLRNFTCMRR
jgi:CheY-like chemotaxis protein